MLHASIAYYTTNETTQKHFKYLISFFNILLSSIQVGFCLFNFAKIS